jgi:hypothetical protein
MLLRSQLPCILRPPPRIPVKKKIPQICRICVNTYIRCIPHRPTILKAIGKGPMWMQFLENRKIILASLPHLHHQNGIAAAKQLQ